MTGAGTPKSSWDSCEAIRSVPSMDQSPPLSNGRLHKSDARRINFRPYFQRIIFGQISVDDKCMTAFGSWPPSGLWPPSD
jgi:hypothetical protein